jgi:hypothetical protein
MDTCMSRRPDLHAAPPVVRRASYSRLTSWRSRRPTSGAGCAATQTGELLNAILLAATAFEQLAAYRFDRAEANMAKAARRVRAHLGDLQLPTGEQP